MPTRQATLADVPRMVALSEQMRVDHARHQPVFWRKAAASAQKQTLYFEQQVAQNTIIARVHEHAGVIDGFVIGLLQDAPPVYDPGGRTCLVDDFMVADPQLWLTVGLALLNDVRHAAKAQGVVQIVVVCGHHDAPKRAMLEAAGLPVASEWRVGQV